MLVNLSGTITSLLSSSLANDDVSNNVACSARTKPIYTCETSLFHLFLPAASVFLSTNTE